MGSFHRSPVLTLAATLALVLAACGGSADEGATATEDDLPEDTVILDVPDDEPSGGETPTTTTTRPEPSTEASTVVFRFGAMGGWDGSDWVEPTEDSLAASVGATFETIELVSPGLEVTATGLGEVCEPIQGLGVVTQPELPLDSGLAIAAPWEPIPRPLEIVADPNEDYRAFTADILSDAGLDPERASVDSVIRFDLEGDGVDEAVVTASWLPDWPENSAGDYSLVYLRRLIDDEVVTTVMYLEYNDPGVEPDFYFLRSALAGLADLNGDGRLEILTREDYYEGAGYIAYEFVDDATGPVEVLAGGCGA